MLSQDNAAVSANININDDNANHIDYGYVNPICYNPRLSYEEFITEKSKIVHDWGFSVEDDDISSSLFPFQKEITKWGLKKAKCAYFAGTGLGKTILQSEFARLVQSRLDPEARQIIVTPLGVTTQTVAEAKKLIGLDINIAKERTDLKPGVNITNYERLDKFYPEDFESIILDESSIIKGYDSKFRKFLNQFSAGYKFKLACSATPAPNDYLELLNHAEWLDVMTTKEAIALFFIQDGNSAHQYRLKKHAKEDFWRWVSSWAIAVELPSDIDPSFDNSGYILPSLQSNEIIIKPTHAPIGTLFHENAATLSEQRKLRKETLEERVTEVKKLIDSFDPSEPVIIWCEFNDESAALLKAIPEAKEIKGSDKAETKEKVFGEFAIGELRILITKPSIAGFGLNWQHCNKVVFMGVSHSMEQTYQAIRRCWRYGQTKPVSVYFVRSELDGRIAANLKSKEHDYKQMMRELVALIKEHSMQDVATVEDGYNPTVAMKLPNW